MTKMLFWLESSNVSLYCCAKDESNGGSLYNGGLEFRCVLLWFCCDTHVFYHLVYINGLYFGSNYCLVGHSPGCVLDDCSSIPYLFDVCSSGSFAGGVCDLYRHVGDS